MNSFEDEDEMGPLSSGLFGSVLDHLMRHDPMRWQGLLLDMETNELTLKAFRIWLSAEWYEQVFLEDEYPEFAFLNNDMVILDMQHELLSSLN